MKFILLGDALDRQRAGIYQYVLQLSTYLSTHWTVIRPENRELDGLHVWRVRWRRWPGYRLYRQWIELPKLINATGARVVVEPAHYGPFRLRSEIRRVTVIHDLTALLYPKFHKGGAVWMHRIFLGIALRKADRVVAVSEATARDLSRRYPFTLPKIRVIPLAARREFKPSSSPSESTDILFVGTLEPRKNIETLLEAFSQLKTKGVDCTLRLIGGYGWKAKAIRQAIHTHPWSEDIHWEGFVTDEIVQEAYHRAFCFVMPSHYEGFGLPVLEAMQSGCPCIVANNSSLIEVGGDAALRFETLDASDLCKQIESLFENPTKRQELISLGLTNASKYSWEATARTLEEVAEELIAE